MTTDISITVKPNDEKNHKLIDSEILRALEKKGIRTPKEEVISVFVKKSIDARHGQIKILLRYKVFLCLALIFDQEFLHIQESGILAARLPL